MWKWALGFIAFFGISQQAFAQGADGPSPLGETVNWELGFHGGSFLPDQIEGVTEIMRFWGLRGGLRTGSKSFLEVGTSYGSPADENNVDWLDLSLSLRWDIPLDSVVGITFIGGDAHYYRPDNKTSRQLYGGGHFGAGVQSLIGGVVWFRGELKFNVHPGTSMHINFGLSFRF